MVRFCRADAAQARVGRGLRHRMKWTRAHPAFACDKWNGRRVRKSPRHQGDRARLTTVDAQSAAGAARRVDFVARTACIVANARQETQRSLRANFDTDATCITGRLIDRRAEGCNRCPIPRPEHGSGRRRVWVPGGRRCLATGRPRRRAATKSAAKKRASGHAPRIVTLLAPSSGINGSQLQRRQPTVACQTRHMRYALSERRAIMPAASLTGCRRHHQRANTAGM